MEELWVWKSIDVLAVYRKREVMNRKLEEEVFGADQVAEDSNIGETVVVVGWHVVSKVFE